MKREQLTEKILDIKREKDWTWTFIAEEIGGYSPMIVIGALLGQISDNGDKAIEAPTPPASATKPAAAAKPASAPARTARSACARQSRSAKSA